MTTATATEIGSLVAAAAASYIGQPSFHHSRFSTHKYFPEIDNLPRDLEVESFLRKVAGLKWNNNYYAYWTEAHKPYSAVGGFDCSLLAGQSVQDVFEKLGVDAYVPRHAAELYAWPLAAFVSTEKLDEGDFIFLRVNASRNPTNHVGIYEGNGKVIHSPGVDGARVERISLEHFISGSDERMVAAKRLMIR